MWTALRALFYIPKMLLLCIQCIPPKRIYKSCGAVPKAGKTFNQHSPDSQTVTEHLRKTINSDINITPQDILCLSCYKLHSNILKEIRNPGNVGLIVYNRICTTGQPLLAKKEISSLNPFWMQSYFVAEHLTHQKAVLLPWVCKVFLDTHSQAQAGGEVLSITNTGGWRKHW